MEYALYLESGPQKKTTLAHTPALLGQVHQRLTTDLAIADAPAEIRHFLRFLARHGEEVDAEQEIIVAVAFHDLSGGFLGTGGFETDLEPVTLEEAHRFTSRHEALRSDTFALVERLSPEERAGRPEKGRPIERILSHILGAEYSYATTAAGFRIEGLHAIYAAADKGRRDPLDALREASAMVVAKLREMTDEDLQRSRERSTGIWTARRMFRSMLEHSWEHHREIETRLGVSLAP